MSSSLTKTLMKRLSLPESSQMDFFTPGYRVSRALMSSLRLAAVSSSVSLPLAPLVRAGGTRTLMDMLCAPYPDSLSKSRRQERRSPRLPTPNGDSSLHQDDPT